MNDTNRRDIDKRDPAVRQHIAQRFNAAIAHNQALGLTVTDVETDCVRAALAWRADFLGDPIAGLWHTAVGISAADSSCGLAVFLALPGMESIATLDLRMDYLRPAVAGYDLQVEAECYHITRCVAFARATLHQGQRERPVSLCTAAFMRTGQSSVTV